MRGTVAELTMALAIMKLDGLQTLATRAIANTPAAFTYGALSENTDAEVATGTTLTGEIAGGDGLARAAMTCSNPSAYVTQWVHTWTATTTKSVRKFAIFNAGSGGNMLMEHLFTVTKGVILNETLTVTAQMTTTAA